MKAVIDTNVWVSGLISASGAPSRVIDAYRFRRFVLVTGEPLLEELAAVLLRPRIAGKYGITEDDVADLLKLIRRNAEIVPVFHTIHCCRDPKDDAVIETAIRGRADVIVTGDLDLWDAGDPGMVLRDRRIGVVSAAEFLARLEDW